jgi:hypothetical protein
LDNDEVDGVKGRKVDTMGPVWFCKCGFEESDGLIGTIGAVLGAGGDWARWKKGDLGKLVQMRYARLLDLTVLLF